MDGHALYLYRPVNQLLKVKVMPKNLQTRERLIDAAYRLASVKGFDRVSTAEILEEAGVRRGSLYYFFPGKDALGLAVLERVRADFMALLDQTLDAGGAPEIALDRFFKAALRKHRETGFVGGCLWGNTALEMSDTNPVFAKVVSDVFDEWIARLTKVMRAGQATGGFRGDRNPADLARMIVATVEGGIMMSRLCKASSPMKACLDTVMQCVLNKDERI